MNGKKMGKKIVGRPTSRVDGEQKVNGQTVYAVDVVISGMLWGKVLRSPIPSGRIKRIDIRRALQVPGVKTVLTGGDLAGLKIGRCVYDMPILAAEVVRFIGEKVAAVAAETEDIAEQALDLIEVEYESTEPILDPMLAMRSTAPLIHPDVVSYKGLPNKLEAPSNVFIYKAWNKGSLDLGFRNSDLIVENIFTTNKVHQAYIEPHSCVVKADESGGAELWSCSKVPYAVRDQLATALSIDPEKLIFHPCYIGGDFGGKGDFMDLAVCYFLSVKSGQPVKMVMDYDEEFIAGNPRHSSIIKIRTGVKKDGTLIAHHMDFIFDSGAYGAFKPTGFLHGPRECPGPYRIPHALVEQRMVYTNRIPCGHMRAPGDPQGIFANESQMDLVARRLGMSPAEIRRKNLMRDGDELPTGGTINHIKVDEALEMALNASNYHKPKPRNTGRGIAVTPWFPNGGEGAVTITIDEKGDITLASAMLEQGAGTYTVLCEIVGEELQVPLEKIRAQSLDTKSGRKDTGVGASRATRVYGNATYEAALKAKVEIRKAAARYLGGNPDDFIIVNGGVLNRRAERRMTYSELAKAKGSPFKVEGYYNDLSKVHEASMCAQVAEVEVDPETGEVKLKKLTSAHHTGTVLNPLMHQGQIEGGAVMGVGYALMENLIIDGGKVVTTSFGDYKIPTFLDIPDLKTVIKEVPKGPGPYHSMAIGEPAVIPVAPAIANAVEDAVGIRIKSLPITAEDIFEALQRKK
jgi:CO/xanthine dehydrogenase Mo-binding subunit